MQEDVVYITPEGLEKIKEELDHLKNEKRVEISERLEKAIAEGDLSENADYAYAKQEQSFVEGRIKDLEDSLRRIVVIQDGGPADRVRVGSTVTIVEEGEPEEFAETYRIVGVHEADPTQGYISNESPIGSALLGAKVNQVVTAKTPAGFIKFVVCKIE